MIPGYQIQEEIFRSRTRVVFRGIQEQNRNPVIIKTLVDEFPSTLDLASLKREYEIIRGFNSEGIARAFALESYEKSLALILEDIGGVTLRSLIEKRKGNRDSAALANQGDTVLNLHEFLTIGIQLASALSELHQNNVIHKDINPKNIIVNPRSLRIELIDFSISSRLPREDQKVSHPSLMEGTLAYMSPEQTGRMNRAIDLMMNGRNHRPLLVDECAAPEPVEKPST